MNRSFPEAVAVCRLTFLRPCAGTSADSQANPARSLATPDLAYVYPAQDEDMALMIVWITLRIHLFGILNQITTY